MNSRLRFILGTACLAVLLGAGLAACKRQPTAPKADTGAVFDQTVRRYGVESGTVTYRISGTVASGEETMRFANFGALEMKETRLRIEVNGVTQEYQQLTILRDGFIYSVDLAAKRGTKMPDVVSRSLMQQFGSGDLADIGDEAMRAMGGREVGTSQILEQDCTLWEIPSLGSTTCLIQGVPLNAEAKLGEETITYTATTIDFDSPVPLETFTVPTDVTLSDAPAPADLSPPSF